MTVVVSGRRALAILQAQFVGAKVHMCGTKTILLSAALFTALSVTGPQNKDERKSGPKPPSPAAGRETYLKYCAPCHGKTAKGDGPAAFVFKTPPSDLTTLSKRHENKFPAGYVGVVLTFGKSFGSHGSEDMPVWGSRFKTLDPVHDPTGQQHINDLVAYIRSLQVK